MCNTRTSLQDKGPPATGEAAMIVAVPRCLTSRGYQNLGTFKPMEACLTYDWALRAAEAVLCGQAVSLRWLTRHSRGWLESFAETLWDWQE